MCGLHALEINKNKNELDSKHDTSNEIANTQQGS
jgi:hypothetical protein